MSYLVSFNSVAVESSRIRLHREYYVNLILNRMWRRLSKGKSLDLRKWNVLNVFFFLWFPRNLHFWFQNEFCIVIFGGYLFGFFFKISFEYAKLNVKRVIRLWVDRMRDQITMIKINDRKMIEENRIANIVFNWCVKTTTFLEIKNQIDWIKSWDITWNCHVFDEISKIQ